MKWRAGEAVTDAWKNEAKLEKRIHELESALDDLCQDEHLRIQELESALRAWVEWFEILRSGTANLPPLAKTKQALKGEENR